MFEKQLCYFAKNSQKFITKSGVYLSALQQIVPAFSLSGIRWASKKASSSKRNHGGKSPGQRLGLKKSDGSYVQPGMILVRQKMAFRWYPGSFVRTGRDKTLSAQVAGRVYFTHERWIPKPDTHFGRSVAPTLSDKQMSRTFIHIQPEPEVGHFKLEEQV